MNPVRRTCLAAAAALAMTAALALVPAHAQGNRAPLRLIVSTPAGSAPDVMARLLGEQLRQKLDRTVIIDNRVGAGGIVAVQAVKSAPADGNTLLVAQAAVAAVTPLTFKAATYDTERDFEAISVIASTPMLFVTNAQTGARSLAEAIALAKAKPDSITIGSSSRTSIPHLSGELLEQSTGAQFNNVPMSNSGQAIQAIVNGDSQLSVDGPAPLMPLVKSGRLRAIAVTSDRVLPGMEGIPLAKDTVPGMVISGWFMLLAPKGVPRAEIESLNRAVDSAVHSPEIVEKLQQTANFPMGGSVADARDFLAGERKRWSEVLQKAGIEAE